MTWRTLDPTHSRGHRRVSIGAWCYTRSDGYRKLDVRISMSPDILAHLGVDGDDRMVIQVGEGDHNGWVRLRKSVNGKGTKLYRRSPTQSGAARIAASLLCIEEPHTAEKVPLIGIITSHDEIGPWVAVELPAWARRVDL